jgi:hypothetical protein
VRSVRRRAALTLAATSGAPHLRSSANGLAAPFALHQIPRVVRRALHGGSSSTGDSYPRLRAARISTALAGMTLSFRKVLVNDYPAFLAWMIPAATWLCFALLPDGRRMLAHDPGAVRFLIILTGAFSPILVWRLHRALWLFRFGRIAPAHVTTVSTPWRGPFTYYFAFEHDGQRIRARMHVARWRRAPALKRGQNVQALYDPTSPRRAIILQFFQTERSRVVTDGHAA